MDVAHTEIAGKASIEPGRHTIAFAFTYDGGGIGKGGSGVLSVNGQEVARVRIERTIPVRITLDEGLDVGEDTGTPVNLSYELPVPVPGEDPQGHDRPEVDAGRPSIGNATAIPSARRHPRSHREFRRKLDPILASRPSATAGIASEDAPPPIRVHNPVQHGSGEFTRSGGGRRMLRRIRTLSALCAGRLPRVDRERDKRRRILLRHDLRVAVEARSCCQYTHTWATFIRAVGEGPDANNYALYQHTISWLPQSLDVRTWSLLPEPGVNLDLYQTLDAVYQRSRARHHVGAVPDPAAGLRAVARGSRRSSTAGGRNTGRSARRGTC